MIRGSMDNWDQLFFEKCTPGIKKYIYVVAEASNRDPKEYLPLLNELRKVEPECYRKYRIDMVRSDWRGALRHLSLVDDKWEEAVALIRDKQLYSAALVIYKDSSRYK
ncbi:hypothetical protein ANCDUO_22276, partial [Ancylostoma duodenale]